MVGIMVSNPNNVRCVTHNECSFLLFSLFIGKKEFKCHNDASVIPPITVTIRYKKVVKIIDAMIKPAAITLIFFPREGSD